MCMNCGCGQLSNDHSGEQGNVTIKAAVRTSTSGAGTVRNGANVGGAELHKSDGSVIKGFDVPTLYGKGN